MASPVIFHVDVNSAFLSWTAVKMLREDPDAADIRNIPSAIGGDVKTRHGIISAKSIPAAALGIHTADPVVKALEKVPNLKLFPADFRTYREFSRELMKIFSRYAVAVDQASIDEAYLEMPEGEAVHLKSPKGGFRMKEDLEGHLPGNVSQEGGALPRGKLPYPFDLAESLREEIYHSLGFTVNIGIAENRLLAKTASDFTKPGRIHTLWKEEIRDKLWPMAMGKLHGCGGKSAERLRSFGILTIGDAAAADPELLKNILGEKGGEYIHRSANGISSNIVSGQREDAKSISSETTVPNDIFYENFETDAIPVIKELSDTVSRRMKKDGVYAATVEFSAKTDDFHRYSRQIRLESSTRDAAVIAQTAELLARRLLIGDEEGSGLFAKGRKVRLIGVGTSSFDRGQYRQMDLMDFMNGNRLEKDIKKKRQLDSMLDKVNKKYGSGTLHKGIG